MTRGTQIITVDKAMCSNYKTVADNFYKGAEVASAYEYWNAAGVLLVHSAIAYADALTIKFGGVKSKGEDHQEIVNLLNAILSARDLKRNALLQLQKIIAHKNSVSYNGDIYNKRDIDLLQKLSDRFKDWAEELLVV